MERLECIRTVHDLTELADRLDMRASDLLDVLLRQAH